jgi:hypothetical protein
MNGRTRDRIATIAQDLFMGALIALFLLVVLDGAGFIRWMR